MSSTVEEATTTTLPEKISCDVAIVGYGPVGMVIGGLLAKRGLDVVAVERRAGRYPMARAGHYDGETMRVFQELGVADAVELAAQPMLLWNLLDADKEVLATIQIGNGGTGWKESYLSYQPEIEEILDERARELGVRVFNNVNVERIEQDAERATLTCRESRDESAPESVIDAAYVIGADGANSFVRSTLGVERASLGFPPMDSLVIDFKLDDPSRFLDQLPEVYQVLDPARPQLAGRWEGRNYSRFEFILHDEEDREEFAKESNCWKLLETWDLTPEDGKIARGVVYRFEATLAPQWRRGRVLLAGDAVHTMPPTMGQGLCSGIRDAVNIAWKLDAVIRGNASEVILDTVQSERSQHVRHLIDMCVGLGSMWNTRDLEAAHRRDEMLRMGNVPPAPSFPRLGPGVVNPEGDGSPLADGRPSPQARVARDGRTDRLDEFGLGWKIVSRTPVAQEMFTDRQRQVLDELGVEFAQVSRGPGPGYYVDLDGEYDIWFRKNGLRAFVQRPDAYVFGAAAEMDELPGLVDRLAEQLSSAGWTFRSVDAAAASSASSQQGAGASTTARTPYPGPVDTRNATPEASELFTSFFTAKTRHEIETTHAFFHPDQVYYADATLGWRWTSNEELLDVWKQYMPFWKSSAKSYPVQVLGDTSGAAVVMTDTPELFGGEIRGIAIVDMVDDKIVRWIDYWDGRTFGADAAVRMRGSAEYPHGLGVDTVSAQESPELGSAVERLTAAIASGDVPGLESVLAYDAVLEDFALRTKIRGRTAIGRYLVRAGGRLPYQGATVTHVVGDARGGGFEWSAAGSPVPQGAAAVTLDEEGRITSLSLVWDGSLLDDDQITGLTTLAVEPRR